MFAETLSGGTPLEERPEMRRLLDIAGPGDSIIVTRLDRAFRSLQALVTAIPEWNERGIGFRTVDGGIDTSGGSPTAMLQLHLLGAFAEFERQLISTRTKEALAYRRSQGVRLGRPAALTDADVDQAIVWADMGRPRKEIARRLGCSEATLRRYLAARRAA